MTLQQLKYILTVYQAGSISKAAISLCIAQSNLSAAIKKLEAEIQTNIFIRTSNGMKVTEAGRQFIDRAARVVEAYESIEQLYIGKEAPVTMLAVYTQRSSEVCYRMAQFINSLNQSGAPFHVQLKETTNQEVLDKVVTGDADLGILRTNSKDAPYFRQLIKYHKLGAIALPNTQFQVLMSGKHPLAKNESLTPEQLAPYIEVVHGDYTPPMYPYSDYEYHSIEGAAPGKRVIFVSDRGTLLDILSTVEGSYMWTTTTHRRLKEALGLVERRCNTVPVTGMETIIYNKTRRFTDEMTAFVKLMTEGASEQTRSGARPAEA